MSCNVSFNAMGTTKTCAFLIRSVMDLITALNDPAFSQTFLHVARETVAVLFCG